MTDHAKSVSRPWRRFLRFTVRGMIVTVLVIGAGLGWLVRSARIQRDAVAAIEKDGCIVYHGEGWIVDWDRMPDSVQSVPRWLVQSFGVDYFFYVKSVYFQASSTASDEVIIQVAKLSQLKILHLGKMLLGDAGLAHLNGLTSLSDLDLGDTQITDAGLANLGGLKNLEALNLRGTKVTDAGLLHLRGMNRLAELDLAGTRLTDAGLAHLSGLTDLSELDLSYTKVADAGLAHLAGLTKLSKLSLHGTQVLGPGLEQLQQALPNLTIYRSF